MSKTAVESSPLVDAVVRLEEELRRYEKLTAEVDRTAITSEKTLARAARAVTDAAACHERFLACVGTLSQAMNDARARQEAALVQMAEAARRVGERATAFQALLARYAGLGEVASELNARAAELAERRANGSPPQEVYDAVGALLEGMGGALTEAESIAIAARDAEFEQIAREADALKQQMASARNRLSLAQRQLAGRAPS